MKKIFKNKKLIPVLILLLIGAGIYRVWLSFSMFAFGDWAFAFSETLRDYFIPTAWGIHGGPLLWKYPILFLFGSLGSFGLSFNVVEKLVIFWPIIFLAPLSSYLLTKKITNSSLAGFVGSLVFSYNTYFLSIDTQGHELLTVAFAIAPFAILTFINLLESRKAFWGLLTALLLFIVGFYDFRSLYILLGVIAIYGVYHQLIIEKKITDNLKINIRNFLLVFILFGLCSLYWLLPVISEHSLTSNEFLIRQLFGGEFYRLQSALTMFYPFWTGKETTWFYVQKIPLIFWLYPILSFLGIVISKDKRIPFFGALAVLGIFLTKQESAPFAEAYTWLYSHIPGFSAFREASKFYFLIALGYGVLIGSFTKYINERFRNKKYIKYLFVGALIVFPLLNVRPIITGEIKTMFVPKVVPKDFVTLKNFIINDKEYSKVLGINLNQYYNFTTLNHPTMDALYSLRNVWGKEIVSYNFESSRTQGEKLIDYLNSSEGRRLVVSSSIRYIAVPIEDKQTNNNIRRDLGQNRKYFEKNLNQISYLTPIDLRMQNILLYRVETYRPHVYTTIEKDSLIKDVDYKSVKFKSVNPTEYHVQIKGISRLTYVNFSELFYPDWKVRIGNFKWYEVFLNKNYFLSDKYHYQTSVRSNGFVLDPKQVCKVGSCHINKDGSFDLDLTIYFLPQSYLYLGFLISGSTLLIMTISLIILLKKRNEK